MTDMEKDKEQDSRLDYIDAELMDIKSVTHKSELHEWGGVVAEHRKLESSVDHLRKNSDFITGLAKSILGLLRITGIAIGVVSGGYGLFKLFF